MFYTKATLWNGRTIEVELYDDEFYSKCSDCGTEIQFDSVEIAQLVNDGGDLAGTSVKCDKCRRRSNRRYVSIPDAAEN